MDKSAAAILGSNDAVASPEMRVPQVHHSLSWRKRENRAELTMDATAATSNLNSSASESGTMEPKPVVVKEFLSANQLVAKAWQLRKKGNHQEAEKLIQEAKHDAASRQPIVKNTVRRSGQDDDDDDQHGPSKKSRRRAHEEEETNLVKRFSTQQERCMFCFENPSRPKDLVVSIGDFSYLMLPLWQPVVPGHCCIVALQHESASRNVDNNVWEEIRNFKKCLIMMFSKQEKDLVFLETVMGLAQQRGHCLIECIPLPRKIAKDAPLYFKKAIDEAEDEWSQHNAKKLIDTSEKGLRACIPKEFPYFHVEFGLNKGFVHVIDDEKLFDSNFGINVIRGMLRLPEERRRSKNESTGAQIQAFSRDWQPWDWTNQL